MRLNQVKRLLLDSVIVTPRASVDKYGQPVAGTPVTVAAKVARKTSRQRDAATGEDYISTTQVITLHAISIGDAITVDGAARPVRSLNRTQGVRGGVLVTVAAL